jgi:hypothetical protein
MVKDPTFAKKGYLGFNSTPNFKGKIHFGGSTLKRSDTADFNSDNERKLKKEQKSGSISDENFNAMTRWSADPSKKEKDTNEF